ncbi:MULTISPECIES: MarR family winged helix-turn-helix transcriptional regulator [unclassified Plantibacter]|uniref:MarR family winged helix-turn-helix transcriptional regulator n=1 Tax=unclassified Plantibacter TaxID=2624265 RepID=UPI000ABD05DD|nr:MULTISPECIES: MarR family transcriptional regulator [unclassified Plantibacter]
MSDDRQAQPSEPTATDPVELIEQALVQIRRDQSGRRFGGRGGRGGPGHRHHDEHGGDHHHDAHGGGGDEHGRGRGPGFGPGLGGPWSAGGGGRHPREQAIAQAARFRMLDALARDGASGGMGISALAEAIGVDQPRASRLVAEATKRGEVARAVDPNDGRRSVVQLSAAGRAVLQEAHRGRREAVTTALADFTPEEAAQFAAFLERFVAAWPRPDVADPPA